MLWRDLQLTESSPPRLGRTKQWFLRDILWLYDSAGASKKSGTILYPNSGVVRTSTDHQCRQWHPRPHEYKKRAESDTCMEESRWGPDVMVEHSSSGKHHFHDPESLSVKRTHRKHDYTAFQREDSGCQSPGRKYLRRQSPRTGTLQ